MVIRILSVLTGLVCLIVVVYLGLQTAGNTGYLVWFGLASAILAPAGFAAIGYAIRSRQTELIKRLSKVPEIENLAQEAKNREEKLRLLEAERHRIAEIIELESRRQYLIKRKTSLEKDGVHILDELKAVDSELKDLNEKVQSSRVTDEIQELHERLEARQKGDLIIRLGSKYFIIPRWLLSQVPFTFGILGIYAKLFSYLFSITRSRKRESH